MKGLGAPMLRQTDTDQTAISSPKIWLTSGAVTKSPEAPSGLPVR